MLIGYQLFFANKWEGNPISCGRILSFFPWVRGGGSYLNCIVAGVLGTLELEEEVAEYEPCEDEEGLSNVPVQDIDEDRDQEENPEENQPDGNPEVGEENVKEAGECEEEVEAQVTIPLPIVQIQSPL